MWFQSLFGRQNITHPPLDLSWIGTDMHSHLIPAVDDGSRNIEETLLLLSKMKTMGYKKVITTPHIKMDMFPNEEKHLREVYQTVLQDPRFAEIDIEFELAAEYFLDDSLLDKIDKKELLHFGPQKYVLVEFSFYEPPSFEKDIFKKFLDAGYVPILAHFERYMYFVGSSQKAQEYREMGVEIQLNLNSLTGHYGDAIKKQAELILDHHLVDFVATDAHRLDHLLKLESALNLPYISEMSQRLFKNQML